MKHLFIILLFTAIGFISISCNRNYVNSRYNIPSKKLFKKEIYYKAEYGFISPSIDTTIYKKNLCRVYQEGVLERIGKLEEAKPTGYWFLFKDSLNLEYIIKYDGDKIDSFHHPFALVNDRW